MKLLIFIYTIFIFTSAFSQQESDNRSGSRKNFKPSFSDASITGYVFDSQSKTPLEGTAVQLFSKRDSSLVTGIAADDKGYFKLSGISQGSYSLHFVLTGYTKYFRDVEVINPLIKEILLDTIYLNTGTETDVIVVESEKPFMELKGEKKIFNVEENMSVKGGTAVDILKNLPSVTVDIDNNVSLRGNSNIKYYINGRPVTGNITRILEQMPSDQVSSVELITNPSAKYDAEGSTGVINLVLKEYDDAGVNGQIDLSTGTQDNYTSGLNMNYKNKDYKVTGSYDKNIRTRFFNANINRENFFSSDEALTDQYSNGRFRSDGSSGKFEFELYPSPSDVLNFNARYEQRTRDRGDTDNLTIYDSQNSIYQQYKSVSFGKEKSDGYSLGLNYFKSFNKSLHNLTGEISFTSDKEYENENKETDYTIPSNQQSLFSRIDANEINKELNIQADYVNKFSKTSGIESGLKFNMTNTNTGNYYYDLNETTKNYDLDTSLTEDFKHKENIAAAYLIYSGEAGNLSYNAGIRGENWNYNLDQKLFNSSITKNIFDLFPSAGITYKLGLTDEIGVSYSRKVRRPGDRELSPVTRVYSPVFYARGNPDLKPEYINSYELNYSKFFKSFSIIPSLFYKITNDAITRTSELIDSNIVLNTSINANTEKNYGAELLVNGSIIKDVSLNASVSFFKQEINSDSLGNVSNNTFSGRLFSNIALPFESGLQLTYFYSGKGITPQGTSDPMSSFDVAVRKDFLEGRLSLNLSVSDVFNTRKFSGSSSTPLYQQTFSRARDSRTATLSLSFKFGSDNKSKDKKKKRQQNNGGNDRDPDMGF